MSTNELLQIGPGEFGRGPIVRYENVLCLETELMKLLELGLPQWDLKLLCENWNRLFDLAREGANRRDGTRQDGQRRLSWRRLLGGTAFTVSGTDRPGFAYTIVFADRLDEEQALKPCVVDAWLGTFDARPDGVEPLLSWGEGLAFEPDQMVQYLNVRCLGRAASALLVERVDEWEIRLMREEFTAVLDLARTRTLARQGERLLAQRTLTWHLLPRVTAFTIECEYPNFFYTIVWGDVPLPSDPARIKRPCVVEAWPGTFDARPGGIASLLS
jgi:hypothetical protein